MTRILTTLAALALLVSCREQPAGFIQLAAPAAAAMKPLTLPPAALAVAAKAAIPTPKPKWSAEPPHAGKELQLQRLDNGQLWLSGDGIDFELTTPEFGDCVTELPEREGPEGMPSAAVKDQPIWLALRGDEESASMRLSTRGALLVIDDGCQRVADVTAALVGTLEGSDDPIFAADLVAPEAAYDSDDISMRRRGKTGARLRMNRNPILEASYFNSEAMLTARTLEDQSWVRLLMAREWEYTSNDGAIGREHTLVWTLRGTDAPLLLFDNDYRYGSDGADREETDIKSNRVRPHPGGMIRVHAKRKTIERAVLRVRSKCSGTTGTVAFKHSEESVRWTFTADGKRRASKLGTAKRRAIYASGCLKAAKAHVKRRKNVLTNRAPSGKVRWHSQVSGS